MANPTVIVDFVANTAKMVQGVKEMGNATDEAGKSTKKLDWKKIAAWGGAAAALGVATKFVKDSASATEDLAKNTLSLQRNTNMDTQTASEWVSVLKQRGVETGTFNKSMVILSKQMTGAADGSKKSIAMFKDLGVSMDDLKKGDTQAVLMKVSDSLSQMQNPARRAAYTQALFGRSSQALTPLLYKGSGAIQEQLDLAKKYGDYIDGDGVGAVKQMAADQREMGFAMDGVKIQLGKALLPVMLALSKVLLSITQALQPIITNSTVLKITLGVLAAAFLAWKVVALASAIANYGLATSMTAALGPIALVIAGIAALIIIGYELYKHWDDISKLAGVVWGAIKDAASAAIDWLKKNWPLILVILTGPFGLAVAAIVTHWDKIKQATTAAWDKVKSLITGALTTIKSAITTFTTWMSTAWDKVKTTLTTVAGWFDKPAQAAQDAYDAVKKWIEKIPDAISAVIQKVKTEATAIANAIKQPINSVIDAWNGLAFTLPKVSIPSVKIPHVGKVGGGSFGGQSFAFPHIPRLATGGVFNAPTLAMVGEGGGREIVTPEALLRSIVAQMTPQVRVYIGDTELRELVRVEAVHVDNQTAAALMGGLA